MLLDKLVMAGIIVLIFNDWLRYPCPLCKNLTLGKMIFGETGNWENCKLWKMEIEIKFVKKEFGEKRK